MAKHIIEASCDGAALCAFDPKALPEQFDKWGSRDVQSALEDLQIENRFCRVETDGDGDFVCHVYVNEEAKLEAAVQARIYHQSDFVPIKCPSGRLWFCGAEFVASEPMKGNALTPVGGLGAHKMGKSIRLKHGTHKMRLTRIDNDNHRFGPNARLDWAHIGRIGGTIALSIFCIFALGSAFSVFGSVLNWASISIFGVDNCRCTVTLEQAERAIEKMFFFLVISGIMAYGTHIALSALPKPRTTKENRKREKTARLQTPDFVFEIITEGSDLEEPFSNKPFTTANLLAS
jgi:hypothetical protein